MIYNLNGEQIRIPDNEIKALMKICDTEGEAINLWLSDNDYITDEEQETLDKKAKDSKITQTICQARSEVKSKTQKERVKKVYPEKERIIKALETALFESVEGAENITIENVSKLITFTIGENKYKLDLIQQRPAKKK